jgi:WD40 repeat protein
MGLRLASCMSGPDDRLSQPSTSIYPAVTARILGKQEGIGGAVAFSPDGQTVASVAMVQGGTLWSVRDGSNRKIDSAEGAITFASNGESLATVRSGAGATTLLGTVQVFDLRLGSVRVLGAHGSPVIALAYSPDGHLLASGSSDRTVRLWDLRSGAHRVLNHPRTAQAVAFSPNGRALAVGVRDGSIKIWKLDREVVADPPECGMASLWESGCGAAVLSGHARPVNSIAFSPDGATLASGSSDGTVRLWNVRDGRSRSGGLLSAGS